ncbi:DNA-processing protein DprA [Flagellimonas meridianipacifica]|uniref:DNA processing protein n=1 Tax=Flagellimonas meridianipacifica TaxID=1080225 RepID=A0A2T0MHI0_9FLAO|nr:DNA-processing protein DprA [Allomuricauda pacifica]PRX56996.1 DNA processing protein [Allomuricauda pacifica]
MTENEIIALLRLQSARNVGNITAKKLIAHCGSPKAVFYDKIKQLSRLHGVGHTIVKELSDIKHLHKAEKELQFIQKENIHITYFEDEDYPHFLKHCVDAPIALFSKGKINWDRRRIISVVGTRNITSYGKAFCEQFISGIAPLDPIIVSGFAYGVDITIQKLAVEHGLQTIGCLAHGLNQMYPKNHLKYAKKVMENGGFVTEFWSSSNPDRENFLKRNRIIAGISEATIVIESAEKGGSLVTADLANGYNREVFAVPGRYTDKYSKGCNDLIQKQKAHMLTSAAELVYFLGWNWEETNQKSPSSAQKQLFVELEPTEQSIYDFLQSKGKQELDSVALECQLPIFKASSTLLAMEMKGVVRNLPGKLFEAI